MSKELPNRRSIRLEEYDYSQPGLYFITICTHQQEHLFGEISTLVGAGLCPARNTNDYSDHVKVHLSQYGAIINDQWLDIPNRFPQSVLHEYVIMPNHFHAILEISTWERTIERAGQSPAPTIGNIIGAFKSITTKMCNQMDNVSGRKIWQRNYHEYIIRHPAAYDRIVQYIIDNPIHWQEDCYY